MSKADLKAAMDSLNVKKPLRLSAQTPSFKAPFPFKESTLGESTSQDVIQSSDPKTSLDQMGSQDLNQSSDHMEPSGLKTSLDTIVSMGEIESSDQNTSSDAILYQDVNESEDENLPQVVQRSTQPRRATAQDKSVISIDAVRSRLSTGYTRIPNAVLMEIINGDLSRNEVKILLLIARMTISFNRDLVPLSKNVIARMTKIQGRAVLEALESLEQAGLVRKVVGDCKAPNRLGLIFDSSCFSPKDGSGGSQGVILPQDEDRSRGLGEISPPKKDNLETIDLNNKLSLSISSQNLKKYFVELKPKKKRETEVQAFRELLQDFSEDQIGDSLVFLQENGLLGSGDPCHSPMVYLSKAMNQVMAAVNMSREKQQKLANRYVSENNDAKIRQEDEIREAQEALNRERAFLLEFPTAEKQEKAIRLHAGQFSLLNARGPAMRNIAIAAWWNDSSRSQSQTCSRKPENLCESK